MPASPKIIILGPAYPYRGGLASFNERLATEFTANGYEVETWTFTLQYPNFLFPGKTQFSEDPAPNNLTIKRKMNAINPLNWIKVGIQLQKANPDLVITAFWLPFMGPCLGTILRFVDAKRIGLVHNMLPHEKRPGDRFFSKYFVGGCDAFLALSEEVKNQIAEVDKSKPKIFSPHPVYDHYGDALPKTEAQALLGLDTQQRYILFFGFIRKYKGLDLLLQAMADERLSEMPIKLIVAGEFYADETEYHALIEKLGIENRLELRTEFIPNEDVPTYFSAADLVVQPYRTATQSGISQLAYYYEKPMVVTRVGGLPEIVPDGKAGYVVDVESSAIASAIHDFFSNKGEGHFEKGLAEGKQRYSWEKLVKEIEELKEKVV